MIGGVVSSTLLTLVVIPAIYELVKGWRLPAKAQVNHGSWKRWLSATAIEARLTVHMY
jgi:antibiotic biosynthesis monooxygenase (ABM) superfamily enzyme